MFFFLVLASMELRKSRCDLIFNGRRWHPRYIFHRVDIENNEWSNISSDQNVRPNHHHHQKPHHNWNPPPRGWVKCNYDASFIQDGTHIRAGWLIKDTLSDFVTGVFSFLPQTNNALEAE